MRSLILSHDEKSGDRAFLMGWWGSASCHPASLSMLPFTIVLALSWSQDPVVALGRTSLYNLIYIYIRKGSFPLSFFFFFFLNQGERPCLEDIG